MKVRTLYVDVSNCKLIDVVKFCNKYKTNLVFRKKKPMVKLVECCFDDGRLS